MLKLGMPPPHTGSDYVYFTPQRPKSFENSPKTSVNLDVKAKTKIPT